jgi:hypothetical protein
MTTCNPTRYPEFAKCCGDMLTSGWTHRPGASALTDQLFTKYVDGVEVNAYVCEHIKDGPKMSMDVSGALNNGDRIFCTLYSSECSAAAADRLVPTLVAIWKVANQKGRP